MAATHFILQSSDGDDIRVERRLLEKSVLIRDMISDLGDEKLSGPIHIPGTGTKVLKQVVEWCQFHWDNPFKLDEDNQYSRKSSHIDKWDEAFMNRNRKMLKELIIVSHSSPCPSTCGWLTFLDCQLPRHQ
jgi:S-phase kinase-associated protein 1